MSVVLGIVSVCHGPSQIVFIQKQPILGFCLITILQGENLAYVTHCIKLTSL